MIVCDFSLCYLLIYRYLTMILSLNWYKNGIFEGKQRKMIMKKDSLKEFFAFVGYHLSATGLGILLGWLISKWLGI